MDEKTANIHSMNNVICPSESTEPNNIKTQILLKELAKYKSEVENLL